MTRPSYPASPGKVLTCAFIPLLSTYCMQVLCATLSFLFTEHLLYTEPSAGRFYTNSLTSSTHTILFLGKGNVIFIQSLPTASLDKLPI